MPQPDPDVWDLALFFFDDHGQVQGHWIDYETYTQNPVVVQPEWTMAELMEVVSDGGGCYVANLNKLLAPGTQPAAVHPPPGVAPGVAAQTLKANDLVIIPYNDEACTNDA